MCELRAWTAPLFNRARGCCAPVTLGYDPLWTSWLVAAAWKPGDGNAIVKQNATLDTSFWINAHRAGLLPWVLQRYRLCYAPDVAAEQSPQFPSGIEFWRLARRGILTEVAPQHDRVQAFGPGERAALNLALEHPGWLLLLDDQRPYQEAVRRGLAVLCSPVLVAALFGDRVLTAQDALLVLARLAVLQTVSPHLLAAALAHIAKIWSSSKGP